jgi:hypothetical protein
MPVLCDTARFSFDDRPEVVEAALSLMPRTPHPPPWIPALKKPDP